jgi:large subunit ribosomal protein L19
VSTAPKKPTPPKKPDLPYARRLITAWRDAALKSPASRVTSVAKITQEPGAWDALVAGLDGGVVPMAALWRFGEQVTDYVPPRFAVEMLRASEGGAKIIEGTKERIQVFEGLVLKRSKKNSIDATFTVRKVSYNIGVERTFPVHSPRIEKVEVMTRAKVRRARLFYIRPLRGKATRMKTLFNNPAAKTEGGNTKAA